MKSQSSPKHPSLVGSKRKRSESRKGKESRKKEERELEETKIKVFLESPVSETIKKYLVDSDVNYILEIMKDWNEDNILLEQGNIKRTIKRIMRKKHDTIRIAKGAVGLALQRLVNKCVEHKKLEDLFMYASAAVKTLKTRVLTELFGGLESRTPGSRSYLLPDESEEVKMEFDDDESVYREYQKSSIEDNEDESEEEEESESEEDEDPSYVQQSEADESEENEEASVTGDEETEVKKALCDVLTNAFAKVTL
eukprot:TRINITY_DN7880_c0_g3_i2.p1 TRINITY_DN7880_c0_g3~~TRINITY_DN7880_c0_g3_i2.p1  ORF type:complete len:253 (+),score=87.53 TRINITY_DN7880_c0_g3_i2:471-1229(+)